MKDIAIYGAGGFGREVACLIQRINDISSTWNLIGFFDDDPKLRGKMISHYAPCLGGIDELNAYSKPLSVTISVGNPSIVRAIVEKIINPRVDFPNLIGKSFYIVDKETFHIGRGNIIQGPGAASCDVVLGDFNVLNGEVVLGHDVCIGSYNTFMPSSHISGEVQIGDGNFFGVNSVVLQQLRIGNNVRLGASSALMTKPKDGNLYIGVPAKKTDL